VGEGVLGEDVVEKVGVVEELEQKPLSQKETKQIHKSLRFYSRTGYAKINDNLRSGEIPSVASGVSLEEVVQHKDNILKHLNRSTKYTGTAYRGMRFPWEGPEYENFVSKLRIGDVVTDKGFVSFSKDAKNVKRFTSIKNSIGFEVKSKTGVDITSHGRKFEQEVLFASNSKFKVKELSSKTIEYGSKTKRNKYDVLWIKLEEI